jgi:hypothetical protein
MKKPQASFFKRINEFLHHGLWSREPLDPPPLDWVRRMLQMIVMIGEGFMRDQLILRSLRCP